MSTEILVVEDDNKLNNGICLALRNERYSFLQCRTIQEARQYLTSRDVALILLDVNLPDGNGIDFIKEIRHRKQTPIIIITVNNMEVDIVTGLEAGANDYITKPFSLMVLRARVEVQLRNQLTKNENHITIDHFDFDFDKMIFLVGGISVDLSKTEQKLLKVLCENRGATVKRSHLIDTVWQGDMEYVDEHALTVTIKRLRDKLGEDSANPKFIKTVYGLGYTWAVRE